MAVQRRGEAPYDKEEKALEGRGCGQITGIIQTVTWGDGKTLAED